MIIRTARQALLSKALNAVYVATDNAEILRCCEEHGIKVVMTGKDITSGTERCYQAVSLIDPTVSYAYVINIQGDEPLIDPHTIDLVALALRNQSIPVSTALCRIGCQEARSENVVKTVIDSKGYIMYCSRLPIPFNGYADSSGESFFLQHIGIYGYQRDTLRAYANMPSTRLQQSEDLEQLKLLENGYRLFSVTVESHAPGVDTLYDVRCVEDLICRRQKESGDFS